MLTPSGRAALGLYLATTLENEELPPKLKQFISLKIGDAIAQTAPEIRNHMLSDEVAGRQFKDAFAAAAALDVRRVVGLSAAKIDDFGNATPLVAKALNDYRRGKTLPLTVWSRSNSNDGGVYWSNLDSSSKTYLKFASSLKGTPESILSRSDVAELIRSNKIQVFHGDLTSPNVFRLDGSQLMKP